MPHWIHVVVCAFVSSPFGGVLLTSEKRQHPRVRERQQDPGPLEHGSLLARFVCFCVLVGRISSAFKRISCFDAPKQAWDKGG